MKKLNNPKFVDKAPRRLLQLSAKRLKSCASTSQSWKSRLQR
ncbi:MAG: hypothetical protein ACLSGI_07880 [Butyricicoccaceae bacterium]